MVGNGSDEIISLLIKAFISPGDEAIMADHTFVMYKLSVTGGHGRPIEIPLLNWRHDLSAMAKTITDRTRLVFICNPNNPTGTMMTEKEIQAFMDVVPDHVIVVFDEAYYEYVRSSEYPDSLQYVRDHRQAIVLRDVFQSVWACGFTYRLWDHHPRHHELLESCSPPLQYQLTGSTCRAGCS